MRVALVYDRVNKWGGAERVLLSLKKIFPEAVLFTSVYSPQTAKWADSFEIKTSFLQYFPPARTRHDLFAIMMPLAFESFSFAEYDLVISVSSEAAKGVVTLPRTKHINYCLTPTRYLWSGYETYFKNSLSKSVSKLPLSYLRAWDIQAAKRPDIMLSISEEVKKRVSKYYGRETEVIYPPFTLGFKAAKDVTGKDKPYYLVVSRLVPYKKVDVVVKAFNQNKLPLVIIGTGSEEVRLKTLAKANIKFVGHVDDQKLATYYANAKGLIFPGVEDFGLTIIEAQGYGTPVLALAKGGALETVIEGKTGMFFAKQSPASLNDKLKLFSRSAYNKKDCIMQAEKFSEKTFLQKFSKIINNI